jgi:hypothetical protein
MKINTLNTQRNNIYFDFLKKKALIAPLIAAKNVFYLTKCR